MATKWYYFVYSSSTVTNQTEQLLAESGVTLLPGEVASIEKIITKSGKIFAIYVGMPSGVNGTVLFKIYLNSKQIFPSEGRFTGSGIAQIFPLEESVKNGDKLVLDIANVDTNPHTVQIMIGVEEE